MTTSPEKQRLQDILQSTAREFSAVFDVDLQSEKQKISYQVEIAGRHLQQQQELFDKTATVHKEVLEAQLPQLHSHCRALQDQFDALDALESLVSRAAADVTRLEAAMTAAEQQILDEAPTFTDRILQPVIRKLDPVPEKGTRHRASFDPSLLFDPSHYLEDCTSSAPADAASNESSLITSSGLRRINFATQPPPAACVSSLNSVVANNEHSSQGYPGEKTNGNVNLRNEPVEIAIEATFR